MDLVKLFASLEPIKLGCTAEELTMIDERIAADSPTLARLRAEIRQRERMVARILVDDPDVTDEQFSFLMSKLTFGDIKVYARAELAEKDEQALRVTAGARIKAYGEILRIDVIRAPNESGIMWAIGVHGADSFKYDLEFIREQVRHGRWDVV